ncbi:hypothetical protein PENANT_c015G06574 [Penicillium antarcticum]|uniref:Berberine/berberine-like domain-containing protein n=1 Tax=Penicillium antarcticum TaxID=416450 RepID=A0A1V6Q4M1_9EURO|nr:hypothetical protein PENANT_c015G06574 [Penicillium antarcticum]
MTSAYKRPSPTSAWEVSFSKQPLGRIATVSETEHSGIYRALRGGGNNFGLVIKFNLCTIPNAMMRKGAKTFVQDQFTAFISAFGNAVNDAPTDEISIPAVSDTTTSKSLVQYCKDIQSNNSNGHREGSRSVLLGLTTSRERDGHTSRPTGVHLPRIACWWADESDDDTVYRFVNSYWGKVREKAQAMGNNNHFAYMDYASQFQDVIAVYVDANAARLQRILRNMIPKRFTRTFSLGHSSLPAVPSEEPRIITHTPCNVPTLPEILVNMCMLRYKWYRGDGESNAVMKPELVAGASTAKIHNRFFATRTPTRWETVVHAGAYVLLFLTPLYLSNQTKSMVQNTRNKKTEAKQQKRSGEKSKSSKSRQRKKNCSSMTLTAQKEKRFISRMSIDTKKKGYGNEVKPTKNIRSKMLNITDRKCEKQRSANDERNYMQRTGSGGYVKWKQNKSDCEWRG